MVLKKELIPYEGGRFAVLSADPGMEDSRTYRYVADMERRCSDAGIEFVRCRGRNLYEDLLHSLARGKTRLDNPPYFTKNRETGKLGLLRQNCTAEYKIAPMDRAVREILHREYGIHPKAGTVGKHVVEKWIGFHAGEWHRVSESQKRYAYFKHPLIDLGMDDKAVSGYFLKNGLEIPPRSVCVACYANPLDYFKAMRDERPDDFEKACLVDDAIRDSRHVGIKDEVFISRTLLPLRKLAELNFVVPGFDKAKEVEACNSGHCFL